MHSTPGGSIDETYREIAYEEHAGVGYLRFDFYNGAMSTGQCRRLREAYAHARTQRQTNVIVLLGGDDYFSNGIHLSLIEAAADPGAESWRNLVAIDDLVRDILLTDSHVVISALGGDAAAGGVPLALAADCVVGRDDIVLNPYYQHMGGLYGSEYWTYLLPRRIGATMTTRLTQAPFNAIGTRQAVKIGLLDAAFGADLNEFRAKTQRLAEQAANDGLHQARLAHKQRVRRSDERVKPLSAYRSEELARCRECFFGPDRSYHDARHEFVYKLPATTEDPSSSRVTGGGRQPASPGQETVHRNGETTYPHRPPTRSTPTNRGSRSLEQARGELTTPEGDRSLRRAILRPRHPHTSLAPQAIPEPPAWPMRHFSNHEPAGRVELPGGGDVTAASPWPTPRAAAGGSVPSRRQPGAMRSAREVNYHARLWAISDVRLAKTARGSGRHSRL